MPAGYSKTPLVKKLGIKSNFKAIVYNEPEHYFDLLADIPENVDFIKSYKANSADFIHLFCMSNEELYQIAEKYKQALKKNGLLWVSWPKGKSTIKTDLNRELVREHLLETGLVDVKVAAIDEDWSGLKFVYRLKDR